MGIIVMARHAVGVLSRVNKLELGGLYVQWELHPSLNGLESVKSSRPPTLSC